MTVKKMSTRPAGADTQVLQAEYTTDFKELQAEFSPRAKGSIALAKSLARNNLPLSRIDRTMSCGDSLAFRRGISQDGELAEISRLHSANFCKDRLCPMCQWRRSRKMYAQMLQVGQKLQDNFAFLFLTLTIPNVSGGALAPALGGLQSAWHNMTHTKKLRSTVRGFVRSLEVTYNEERNDFHPHLHILLAVDKSYFQKKYITQAEWLELWRSASQNPDICIVDIRRIKANPNRNNSNPLASTLAEVCKYPIKPLNLEDDSENLDYAVKVLSEALKGVRCVSFGGCFAEVRKSLKLDDIENGDLTHTEVDTLERFGAYLVSYYRREYGYSDYYLDGQRVEVEEDASRRDAEASADN